MARVDFWSAYQQGQQARFNEETMDARKRGIEAGVGERELALQKAKDEKMYDDQWNNGWQDIMSNYIAQANAPMQQPSSDWQSPVQRPERRSSGGGGMGGIASMFGGGGGSGGGGGNTANANLAI